MFGRTLAHQKRLQLWLFSGSVFFDGAEVVLVNIWQNGFTLFFMDGLSIIPLCFSYYLSFILNLFPSSFSFIRTLYFLFFHSSLSSLSSFPLLPLASPALCSHRWLLPCLAQPPTPAAATGAPAAACAHRRRSGTRCRMRSPLSLGLAWRQNWQAVAELRSEPTEPHMAPAPPNCSRERDLGAPTPEPLQEH